MEDEMEGREPEEDLTEDDNEDGMEGPVETAHEEL